MTLKIGLVYDLRKDYLAQGYLYKEIADVLKISYTTVNTHIRHIYEKLHVTSRTEAVSKHLRAR